MKNQKTMMIALLGIILFSLSGSLSAQEYGGSAYAYVKDDKGNSRCITVTEECKHSSTSSAKEYLLHNINMDTESNEELSSSVSYSIDPCTEDDEKSYGGSGSVKVSDDKGKTRIINVTVYCKYGNRAMAKEYLLHEMNMAEEYNEKFISPVSFSLDSCED